MDRKILIPILIILSILVLGYAIYRSTAEVITIVQADRQITYGEPQHGLILGLCVFAGFCVLAAVQLLRDDRRSVNREENYTAPRTGGKVATNYPH
jgi:hypothetical protein